MKERRLYFRAAITLLAMLLTAATAWADDASGTCGDNLSWVFTENDGTLTFSGTGDIPNYGGSDMPWYEHITEIKKVVPAIVGK